MVLERLACLTLRAMVLVVLVGTSGGPDASAQDSASSAALPAALTDAPQQGPVVILLGTAQDGGYPQAGCHKPCCARAWTEPKYRRNIVSMAIVDEATDQRWLLDCTPDFREQLHQLDRVMPVAKRPGIDGILLTHAHIGHYTGLMHLGREVMGTDTVPVFAMPRMRRFLESNGPWSQLVKLGNIALHDLQDGQPVKLNENVRVTPLLVPHRDEYSEAVGFRIEGPTRSVLFLPDIDKWDRWEKKIEEVLRQVDVAYVDGTFFAEDELPGRDMSEIPHPFIVESIERFKELPARERTKIRFLHFNHTNPCLDTTSPAARRVRAAGHHVAVDGELIAL